MLVSTKWVVLWRQTDRIARTFSIRYSEDEVIKCTCALIRGTTFSPSPQTTIKQGDLLLNRIQKLSRVINT